VFAGLIKYLDRCAELSKTPLDEQQLPLLPYYVGSDMAGGLLHVANMGLQLVSKWLSARKRPRDWKQQEYSTAVLFALSFVSRLLRAHANGDVVDPGSSFTVYGAKLGQLPKTYNGLSRLDIMGQTFAAQQEVCQLLQAALKQQQQGQQAAQDAAQQLTHLCDLAKSLLDFWTAIDGVWSDAYKDVDPPGALSAQKPALELAVVLSQTLTADTPSHVKRLLADVTLR
jgi:hypothetical protein